MLVALDHRVSRYRSINGLACDPALSVFLETHPAIAPSDVASFDPVKSLLHVTHTETIGRA